MTIETLAPSPTTPPSQAKDDRRRILGMSCRNCGHTDPVPVPYVCPACFGPLEVAYDLAVAGETLTRDTVARRAPGI